MKAMQHAPWVSMRRPRRLWAVLKVALALMLATAVLAGTASPPVQAAEPQLLLARSYRHLPERDLVLLDLSNPLFVPVDQIRITMTVRSAQGKPLALGKAQLPVNLVLQPGEHTTVQVPVAVQIVPRLPDDAAFEFMIMGQPAEEAAVPPPLVIQGEGLELSRDEDEVPWVMGFAYLDPLAGEDAAVQVEAAVMSFYDEEEALVWTEVVPFGTTLRHGDTLLIAQKMEALAPPVEVAKVEAHFVARNLAP